MKKSNIMPSVVLGAVCLIVALLLSLINSVTAPLIEEAQNAAIQLKTAMNSAFDVNTGKCIDKKKDDSMS